MTKKQFRHYSKKGKDPYNLGGINDFIYDRYTVMSNTECTGLIPNDPEEEEKRDNYKEIYDIN